MNPRSPTQPPATKEQSSTRGFLFGIGAYGLWGGLPIYFKLLDSISAIDIVAHRVIWSLLFLFALVAVTGTAWQVRQALRHPGTLLLLATTAVLIAINWLLYVYAVVSGHILAGSLGYYLNPLANVLLGRFILKERLSWLQWAAVGIAFLGVSALAVDALGQLWISLTLCVSFATYGLLRKIMSVDAVAGLTIETALLFPVALLWLSWGMTAGSPVFGTSNVDAGLLVLTGVATTIPLLLFTAAARLIPYSTLGMLQFLAPTLQFLIAVLIYDEPLGTGHAIAFSAIWIALALYVIALMRQARTSVTLPE